MRETVLVTGGGGFIGSLLVRKLLNENYKVICLDSLFRPAHNLVELCSNDNFEFIHGDILKTSLLRSLFKREIHHVVHLAALCGQPICDRYPSLARDVNVDGTVNLLAYKDAATNLFFSSTGSVYGNIGGGTLCHEDLELKPVSWYAETKRDAEDMVLAGKNTYVYRFSTACGVSPNPRLNLLPNDLAWRAVRERSLTIFQADFQRSFINVEDMANAFVYGVKNINVFKEQSHRVYNVGDPQANWTKRELAEYLRKYTGCHLCYVDSGYVDPDQRNYAVSFDRIYETGWRPKFTVEEGLEALIKSSAILESKPQYD